MCCQVTRLAEYLVTFVTQASYLCDSFVCFHITLITHERFLSYLGIMYSLLPCAGSLMSCQGTRLCKCLVTLITLKGSSSVWFLLCFARYPQFVNALSHWSHLKTSLLYGFSYVMSGYQTLWKPRHIGHTFYTRIGFRIGLLRLFILWEDLKLKNQIYIQIFIYHMRCHCQLLIYPNFVQKTLFKENIIGLENWIKVG